MPKFFRVCRGIFSEMGLFKRAGLWYHIFVSVGVLCLHTYTVK